MLNLYETRIQARVVTSDGREGHIAKIGSNPYATDTKPYAYVEGVWNTGNLRGCRWADYFSGDQLDLADDTERYFDWLHDHTVDLDAPDYLTQMVDVMLNGLGSIRSANAYQRVESVLLYDLKYIDEDQLTAAAAAIDARLRLWGARAEGTQIGGLLLTMVEELERREQDAEEESDDPYFWADYYEDDLRRR